MAATSWSSSSCITSDIAEKLKNNVEFTTIGLDSKSYIAVDDTLLLILDVSEQCIISINTRFTGKANDDINHCKAQTLILTNPPWFDVDILTLNVTGQLLALWGRRGVAVAELPRRWGKGGVFEGGKPKVTCRCWHIAEHFFVCNKRTEVAHVAWHPGSESGTHLTVLSTDNYLRIYEATDPQTPIQAYSLGPYKSSFYLMSSSQASFSTSLGETAVSFDFGPALTNNESSENVSQEKKIWPAFVLKGNGDIYVVSTTLKNSRVTNKVQGPLTMHPPAEDNYGVDACSVLCLPSVPPVLVIAISSNIIYHSVILTSDSTAKDDERSELSWTSTDQTNSFRNPELGLYVYESVELPLTLTDVDSQEDSSCPIRLQKDPTTHIRYHCSHNAGVHSVALPLVYQLERFAEKEDSTSVVPLLQEQECIVEHLLCTRPLPSSPSAPVLGLAVMASTTGASLICLLSTWEFVILPLVTSYHTNIPSLLSSELGETILSPLHRLHGEGFKQHIYQMLQRTTSTPLLKYAHPSDGTEPSPQHCLEVLGRTTQHLREDYIQRLDGVQVMIERRVRALKNQKDQQFVDIEQCLKEKEMLCHEAERLAEKYDDTYTRQQELVLRIEQVLQQLHKRLPVLSDAEVGMKQELLSCEEKLKCFHNSLEHIHIKQKYQADQIIASKHKAGPEFMDRGSSADVDQLQLKKLTEVLKQQGNSIADLIMKIKSLKKQVGV
ncbi:nuclear pore complex protein Nup88-like isoform X2 [Limulus polyphemus]|uniref:Nuclear pore complex protein Nup88-like isoform X2 n=1 Tax=Limulus polyphemus TaxID=6850 RepID=A0ABM1B100_LIMPO|nr:nuclear pore complex protein Nup88-like isoform X2 [Limulus polyphemus]